MQYGARACYFSKPGPHIVMDAASRLDIETRWWNCKILVEPKGLPHVHEGSAWWTHYPAKLPRCE